MSWFLKVTRLSAFLSSKGKEFQRVGPATENALFETVIDFVGGTQRSTCSPERKRLLGLYGTMNSCRYDGAKPFLALKTSIATLNKIR